MYLNYYNLKKEPFHITPDPEFLYLSPSHKEALGSIIYGIEQKKGFVVIIGAVGVGKTTILRSYLDTADKKHLKIIYIFNARLTFEELVKTIYQELGIDSKTDDIFDMVNNLYKILIDEYTKGNSVVLVIDEAQNVPVDTLENLRMLSNLETPKDKLIQIVLVGQPEFEERLNMEKLKQLKQRIAIRSTILPLTKPESLDYIEHRLLRAGTHSKAVFTQDALEAICKKASGIPRTINILCDNALITGFGYQQKPVSSKVVREVIRDIEGKRKQSLPIRHLAWGFAAVILVVTVFLTISYGNLAPLKSIFLYGNLTHLRTFFTRSSVENDLEAKKVQVPLKTTAKPREERRVRQIEEERPATAKAAEAQKEAPVVKTPPVVAQEVQSAPRQVVEEKRPVTRKRTVKVVPKTRTTPPQSEKGIGDISDDQFTTLIQDSKPQVSDPNLIMSGSKIKFPNRAAD
ncbi:MAG TPA: AAA family ATPase [Syntrophorhabdus sp.]|jgi:general secretion pathway protein A|nr:AAA family ATPase [Syntrophorhabdus sp.]OPX95368.1 MAG: hypothetical protein A4E59_01800 [Syntrophorhabdus sp. PtaB.Bin027]OQB74326.1 MAG: hypothetical protein BWX92_03062 [Deltaproteobacteria bacterium ADurb.Bin135]HQI95892.1 AAA family ATPase [Syntrophorhabdus sp.]HQM27322.1 AAA family ATPase [Syntrophorhabdus sp.]